MAATAQDKPPEFDRLAVVTIQGGGLYGLNLLGQLSYLSEVLKIVPVAVAGNSAGSVVAVLYWAGYAPWEIRDIFAKMARRKELGALVGPFVPEDAPYTLADFRALKKDCERFVDEHMATEAPAGWFRRQCRRFQVLGTLWSLRGIRNRVTPHFATRGSFLGDKFIDEIDRLIREGPLLKGRENVPTGEHLAFGDVRKLIAEDPTFSAPALFLTATNVTGRRLEVFSSIDDRYDRVPIAKAVRASAGFPVFFRPVEFKDNRYAGWYSDGGIVSNYPSWIFSKAFRIQLLDVAEYRPLASRPWVHFGLRLERAPITDVPRDTSPKLYASSLARLVLGGEARTELEGRLENLVTRSFTVELPADKQLPPKASGIPIPEDLLDIDAISEPLVRKMYDLGRNESVTHRVQRVTQPDRTSADRTLAEKLGTGLNLRFKLPEREIVEPLLHHLIERALLVFGEKNNTRLLFRSNVFIPHRTLLRIQYAANMDPPPEGTAREDDTANWDHDLQLPLGAGLTGACLYTRRPLLCNLGKLKTLFEVETNRVVLNDLFGMPPELHDKVRGDRTWLVSVPIFDPFASYPRELSNPSEKELPHPTAFSHGLAGRTDGAVLGVLNLDARLEYDKLVPPLKPDPAEHCTDRCVQAILHLMAATAAEIGDVLSRHFAHR